ncbi:Nicotinate-nucleotide adenylyltransferase [Poriferisphaera corsica]|uniref:Probable nicotinate-nucleotide adenylyltransferase n=1 Tax=Poriferisphaera corsica TaxID=2528020 RepID=A0A517YUB8_9BACT|nr:nicotinate (nicotinamide) nucleotide adenylyltransferase [Poriferisphaera corsica]QDU33808.1 Nicotinate-nucleotide adenylyltransferase [Poriferisphaera corsica]
MDLTPYKNIIVFGGSFDPPHKAHLILPELVREQLGADLVLYIPAGRAPHKLDKVQTDPMHRLNMLKLALDESPNHALVASLEIDRANDGQPSYTVNTLQQLKQLAPHATFRLLFGADQLRIFDQWYQHKTIEEIAEPIVMVRSPDSAQSLLESLSESQRTKWADRLVELPLLDISSTNIRDAIASSQTDAHNSTIPASVLAYIQQHHLYQDRD